MPLSGSMEVSVKNKFFTRRFVSARCKAIMAYTKSLMRKKQMRTSFAMQKWGFI